MGEFPNPWLWSFQMMSKAILWFISLLAVNSRKVKKAKDEDLIL